MTTKLILKNITFFLIILLSINDVVAQKFKYGYIRNITSSSNRDIVVRLQRGDEDPWDAYPGVTIFVGDKLTFETDDIIVEYCNILAECKQATDTTVFPAISNEESSVIKMSATKVDDVLSRFGLNIWEITQYYVVQAVSRGDSNISKSPPSIILANMTKAPQYIFSSKRSLAFQWGNGATPFTIKITQQEKLVFNAQTREQKIQTNQINWSSGEYQISIEDKYGKAESIHFYVVDRPEFAKQLHSYFSGESNKSIHQYTRIGTMAMVDGGRYTLEAYQQLLPISTQSAALTSLQKAIEAGEIFPDIKSEEVMQRLLN